MHKRRKINNLKLLRITHGLTQNELGTIAGVTSRTIQFYETGKRFPPVDVAKKIADEFEKPIEEIFFNQ
jgi:DNA-binding XRE family transcriptional regulator